jgi:nitroimidazol reductase NimA-like FMN-containing flavoprotein (pyridoxamine 5'-phosphate oxidase superfamily)
MRKADREIKDFQRLSEIVKNGKFAVLALCRNNEPYAVTLSYGYDEANGDLYFHGAKEGLKADFIGVNPRACLTVIDDKGYIPHECGHAYRTVVIRGEMRIIESDEEKEKGIGIQIRHFEENPDRMMTKITSRTPVWEKTQMWKLHIEDMTGKERGVIAHAK